MINWPEGRQPGRSAVHVKNEIEVAATPEAVWSWLVRASAWPEWYSNSHDVMIEGGARDLSAGSAFHWKTFGLSLRSRVEEFVPNQRLSWTADGTGVHAYHSWLIEGRPAAATYSPKRRRTDCLRG